MPLIISSPTPHAPGRRVWSTEPSPVATEDNEPWRAVEDGLLRLAVAGHCYAGESQLRKGLRAVRARDWTALTRWPGSYWVLADDGDTTAVLTDLAATRPVYYMPGFDDGCTWSTSALALARRSGADVDHAALTARMVCPTVPEICGTESAFHGVRRLPGGHALLLGRDGSCRTVAYEPRRTVPFQQAAREFRESLVAAVQCRARSAWRLTADFSGGLDSTSVALLALRDGAELFGVTHHPTSQSDNDDLYYARQAAAGQTGLTHREVRDERGLFFEDLHKAPPTDQPFPDAARWRMRYAYQRHCAEWGSDVHLTGSGGDTLLTASPFYLADLTRTGGSGRFARHCLLRARLRHFPVYTVAARALLTSRTSNAQALRRLARDLTTGAPVPPPHRASRESLGWMRLSAVRSWLTDAARDELSRRLLRAAEECAVPVCETSRHRYVAELHEFGSWEAELRTQAEGMGVPHHAPLLDSTVVRAALAVPVVGHASTVVQKPLLEAALHGLVPDWLLHRSTKGAYFGSAYTGLRRNADTVRELIASSRLAAEGWIDAGAALAEVDRLTAGAAGKWSALEALTTTEMWLAQHSIAGGSHA
ncbi:albusnodin/ikarugamycin family macrolactam cyclase [Streptomyces boncukensis]|uniref:asparagine synthase (glutamine-hydrolyzing) n=1 Tax=Streptomyces boncukensis TaxID=2711219 RepID=A0A6G4WXJ2_9ACTN|nr:albusnodin/ikarugamycin family macrolactam cyclase [Streptomyces boncukensis]NGO70009.1 albusnodin/ikarugamycin family macrolactam cyclase [Streptomyces boncukensis]